MDKTWLLPLLVTVGFNLLALGVTYVLFRTLKSTASVDGAGRPRGLAKWRATGALAGFVIVLSLQVTLLKWLLPMPEQPFPDSYGAVRSFFRNLQAG